MGILTNHRTATSTSVMYDHQAFAMQQYGGVSRYFAELADGLQQEDGIQVCFPWHHTDNIYYHRIIRNNASYTPPGWARTLIRRIRGYVHPHTKDEMRNRRAVIAELKEGAIDVFHPTYYDPYFLEHLNGKPFVLTVYDMIHEKFPEYFAPTVRDALINQKKELIRSAARIIAISDQTKKDIVELHAVPEQNITTVYLATSFAVVPDHNTVRDAATAPYMLFVGTRDIYKNFTGMMTVMSGILRTDRTMRLICAGPAFSPSERSLFASYGIADQVIHMPANTDDALRALYTRALFLIYPSLYEGFGLPILEAFACGCPVLTANRSSIPEVGGDAVYYCDPTDHDSVREGVMRMLKDRELRTDLRRRGFERLKQFTWASTVHGTASVYHQAKTTGTMP
ncbi:MAG: glycosyltransferase family 4 protein [Bacteroidetes bacterium]|nr:glycosyltransferase family 4 protein [Bacteroidota bacterium]